MPSLNGNKAFKSGTKKVLYIIKFCNQETKSGEVIVSIPHFVKQARQIGRVCVSNIKKICVEAGD